MDNKDYDWFRFWVHFVFGVLLGVVMGLVFCMRSRQPSLHPWLLACCCSLIMGFAGGIYGDRFWEWFLRNIYWWRP